MLVGFWLLLTTFPVRLAELNKTLNTNSEILRIPSVFSSPPVFSLVLAGLDPASNFPTTSLMRLSEHGIPYALLRSSTFTFLFTS